MAALNLTDRCKTMVDRTIDEIDCWIDAGPLLAGFTVAERDRQSVRENLEVARRMKALLDTIVLDDGDEPATVFHA